MNIDLVLPDPYDRKEVGSYVNNCWQDMHSGETPEERASMSLYADIRATDAQNNLERAFKCAKKAIALFQKMYVELEKSAAYNCESGRILGSLRLDYGEPLSLITETNLRLSLLDEDMLKNILIAIRHAEVLFFDGDDWSEEWAKRSKEE